VLWQGAAGDHQPEQWQPNLAQSPGKGTAVGSVAVVGIVGGVGVRKGTAAVGQAAVGTPAAVTVGIIRAEEKAKTYPNF
jgi:hypothetical protein